MIFSSVHFAAIGAVEGTLVGVSVGVILSYIERQLERAELMVFVVYQ